MLREKKVIAFTATSSVPYERFIHNTICHPTVLKFKSEYEMVKGISPVNDPHIVACSNEVNLIHSVITDIQKHYDIQPIVLIVDDNHREKLVE